MKKIWIIILSIIFVVGLILWFWNFGQKQTIELGVTFSQPQAEYLQLDWQKTYTSILDDLGVKHLRLLAYWPTLEKKEGQFDFSDLDWQVKEAQKRGAKVIMTIGRRLPHWPECHTPDWAQKLDEAEAQKKILTMLEKVVSHYKKDSNILMWQVDNEPLVGWFGLCPKPDPEFIKKEIALVKSLDFRPVLITDSGELSLWRKASQLGGDYFGTTMYRTVWSYVLGYMNYQYLIPPAFYNLKARAAGLYPAGVIVAELQAEAWLREDISKISLAEQRKSMNSKKLEEAVVFARRTGFGSAYLWGVEYWYWLKVKMNDDSLWWTAKQIFQNNLPK